MEIGNHPKAFWYTIKSSRGSGIFQADLLGNEAVWLKTWAFKNLYNTPLISFDDMFLLLAGVMC